MFPSIADMANPEIRIHKSVKLQMDGARILH